MSFNSRRATLFFYLFNKSKLDDIDNYFLAHTSSPDKATEINEKLFNSLKLSQVFTFDEFKQYVTSQGYFLTQDTKRFYIDVNKYKTHKRNDIMRVLSVVVLIAFLSLLYFAA